MTPGFSDYLKSTVRSFHRPLILAALSACVVSVSAVGLLGLSGWFLTAAAIAGAAGPAAAQALNYLLPSAAIRLFAILRTGFRYLERLSGHEGGLKAMARVRPHLFAQLVNGPPQDVLALSQGEASSRFIQDVGQLEAAFVARSAPALALAGLVSSVSLCALLSVQAAALCLLGLVAMMLAGWRLSLFVDRRQMAGGRVNEQALLGELKQRVFELAPLLPDMAAFDLDMAIMGQLESQENALKLARTQSLSLDSLLTIVSSAMLGLPLIAISFISRGHSLPALAMALLATGMGFESAGAMLTALSRQRLFRASEARLEQIYEIAPSPPAAPSPGGVKPDAIVYKDQVFVLDGSVRLLISGPSGSGKTRLISALTGLADPSQVPGLNEGFRPSRAHFSLCPQDAMVISGTIRENLLMGLDEKTLSGLTNADVEARLNEAVDDAGLGARLRALAKGLDSWIGEGGITLSGGERKRLSLARAYLRQAPVLVLDEPTEGLDAAMEAFVIDRLRQRLERTRQGLIFTSHRPSPRALATSELMI